MTVTCPTCGAPVEFRFDDTFVRVCAACAAAVTRTDRGAETLGQFADLIPIDSPLKLFASGTFQGQSFLLVGMAQLRHGSGGIWQEWYARFGGGAWGWLAEAQGRFYLTFARPAEHAPAAAALAPGMQLALASTTFTVAEVGVATYLAAAGEIPFRLTPGETYAFADLADGQGGFATIDHGSPGTDADDRTVYIGQQVALADFALTGGEEAGAAAPQVQGGKLACPNCGGSLELRVPDQTLRVGCPYCAALVSVASGPNAILGAQTRKPALLIPLGTRGTFAEGALTVVGWLQRSAHIEDTWYPFEEYLLYAPAIGFRWLVQSEGHWSYVQPIAPGAVDPERLRYDGVTFRRFQQAPLRVDLVLGELYWKVELGEQVQGLDCIAPPAMLSQESTSTEQTWSLSTYLEPAAVRAAFGFRASWQPPPPQGVGPNQPRRLQGLGTVAAASLGALVLVAVISGALATNRIVHAQGFALPPIATPALPADPSGTAADATLLAETPSNVVFSQPFQLAADDNVVVELAARPTNGWAYAAVDLVNDDTGSVVSFDLDVEYYTGYDGGESWTEGETTARQFLPPSTAGTYVLRLETLQSAARDLPATVTVRQDVFRARYALGAAAILLGLFGALGVAILLQHKQRWENSNLIPRDDE